MNKSANADKALTYTQWYIKYPWHVSGSKEGKYPHDRAGNCTCRCQYCVARGKHKATRAAHLRSK